MKKIFSAITILLSTYSFCFAQPPVTSGLVLHLDASVGFTQGDPPLITPVGTSSCPGGSSTGTNFSYWQDISGYGNDVQTGDVVTWPTPTSIPQCNNANPQLSYNVWNSGFDAVHFDGNDYMTIPVPGTSVNTANGLTASDNVTEVTIFVVREAKPGIQSQALDDRNDVMVSLSDTDPFSFPGITCPFPPTTPNIRDEFVLMRDWAASVRHLGGSACGNDMAYREHQCFQQLPANRPVVLSTTLGTTYDDIEYYINGVQSTQPTLSQTSSTAHQPVNRTITIGARHGAAFYASPTGTFQYTEPLEGYLFEVLVFNRKLDPNEMDQVNDWLKCKYDIRYSACNSPIQNCPKACWEAPYLDVKYLGMDPSGGGCMFECTAHAQPMPGVTNFIFDWEIPGTSGNIIVYNSANQDQQTFTVPYNGDIKVKVLGANSGVTEDLPCCEYTMTRAVWCGDIDGGTDYEKPGRTTSIAEQVNSDANIKIYPNPADKDVNVKIPDVDNHQIVVMDFTGRILQKVKVLAEVTTLSFNSYTSGVYVIQVFDAKNNIVTTEKVVLK